MRRRLLMVRLSDDDSATLDALIAHETREAIERGNEVPSASEALRRAMRREVARIKEGQ